MYELIGSGSRIARTSFLLFLWVVIIDLAIYSLLAISRWNNVISEKDF